MVAWLIYITKLIDNNDKRLTENIAPAELASYVEKWADDMVFSFKLSDLVKLYEARLDTNAIMLHSCHRCHQVSSSTGHFSAQCLC